MSKVRTDYITNSSSSSYIIAIKKQDDNQQHLTDSCHDLIKNILLLGGNSETDEGDIVENISEYEEYFIEQYGYYGNEGKSTLKDILTHDDYLYNLYHECKKYLENGYDIILKDVDNHDCYCHNVINEISMRSSDIVILEKERV